MPVTLTIGELAAAVRVSTDPTSGPGEPYLTELTRQLDVAKRQAELYAVDAPDEVLNEAVVVMVGYMFDSPPFARSPMNAFRNSGAQALLAPYHALVTEVVD